MFLGGVFELRNVRTHSVIRRSIPLQIRYALSHQTSNAKFFFFPGQLVLYNSYHYSQNVTLGSGLRHSGELVPLTLLTNTWSPDVFSMTNVIFAVSWLHGDDITLFSYSKRFLKAFVRIYVWMLIMLKVFHGIPQTLH